MALTKRTKALLGLAAVAVAAGALLALLQAMRQAEEGRLLAAGQEERLFPTEARDVERVEFEFRRQPILALIKSSDGDTFDMVTPLGERRAAEPAAANRLLSQVLSLRRERLIEPTSEDLAQYGLAAPELSLRVAYSGSERRLLIGDESSFDAHTYVVVEGSRGVLLVRGALRQLFAQLAKLGGPTSEPSEQGGGTGDDAGAR